MAKRTFAFVAVFTVLLSVTLSVQAENYDYYWSGSSDSYYLTTGNWNVGSPSGQQATVGLNTSGNNITAYMYNTNGVITLHNNNLGTSVYSVNIGTENGTGSASLFYDHNSTYYDFYIENGKTLSVYDGGTFTFAGAKRFVNNGTVNLNSGANFIVTEAELVIIDGANSVLNIKNGSTLTVTPTTYIGTANNGATVNQTGGDATFNGRLALGWGDHSGYYNLSGGTLTTTGEAGLWGANGSGISEFTVSGGTANFNKTGNSFEIGLGGSNALANKFTLQGTGIVNVADTFAVKNSGILSIEGGTFNAPTITVDNTTSSINMTGGALNATSINMNGKTFTQSGGTLTPKTNSGLTISGGYTLDSGATLKPNGPVTVNGTATLNGTIDMTGIFAAPNQTLTLLSATTLSDPTPSISTNWKATNANNTLTATFTEATDAKYYLQVAPVEGGVSYNTASNWKYYTTDGTTITQHSVGGSYIAIEGSTKDCYILPYVGDNNQVQDIVVKIDNGILGVKSLTVGNGIGGSTGTVTLNRGSTAGLKIDTVMTVNKGATVNTTSSTHLTVTNSLTLNGGEFNAAGATSVYQNKNITINSGTYNASGETFIYYNGNLTIDGGTFAYSSSSRLHGYGTITLNSGSFTVGSSTEVLIGEWANDNADAFTSRTTGELNINGGTLTVDSPIYISTGYDGTVNQTAGTATFNNKFYIGWGINKGKYNLSGGTMTTTGVAGLWNQNDSGVSTFNVTGGQANFNTFVIGLTTDSTKDYELANVFNLNSGEVNTTETFTIRKTGTLNVAKNGETGGDGVFNANSIEINNKGKLNMSSGTINLGSGGITSSGGTYTITLSGGTFGTYNANWRSDLDATISSNTVTFDPDPGRSITWGGTLSGDGGITKTGEGSLTIIAGASGNTYTGGTTVSAGTLYLQGTNNGKSSVGTGDLTINSGAIVEAQSANVLGHTSAANIPHVIINGGSLTPKQYLHMKSLEINSGTVNSHGSSGDGLDFSDRNGTITSTGASSIASAITNSSTLTINVTNGELTLSGSSINNKTETSKTIIQQGTVKLTGSFTSGKRFTGTITIAENATLNCAYHDSLGYDSDTTKINIYGLMDNSVQNETLNNTELHMYGGTAQSSSGGTFDILNSGVKFYSYPKDELQTTTTVSTISSDLRLRHGNTLAIDTAANSHLKLTGEITGLYSGTENTCSITKLGAGTLTLSGANTYKGETIVNVGVLELTGDAVVANGPVTVDPTGTLVYEVGKDIGGQPITKKLSISETNKIYSTGTVKKTGDGILQLYSAAQGLIDIESLVVSSGQVDLKGYMTGGITVDANAVFSPGNSVGEATFGGDYILYEGATLLIEMDNTGIDKLTASSFDLSDGLIQFENNGIPGGSRYDILHATGNTVFSLDDDYLQDLKNSLPEFMTLSVEDNGKTVRLLIDRNAVPEPSTWALLALGAAGMLYWRKRKNNK